MKRCWLLILVLILTVSCMHKSTTEPTGMDDLSSISNLKVLDVKPLHQVKDKDAMKQIPASVLKEEKHYTGKPISLSFFKADIHDFFRAISEVAGVNFLVHERVKGTITIEVKDVPWDQLLDTVLEFHKLTSVRKGAVIEIIPRELADKSTEVIKVNYGTAEEIVKTLQTEGGFGSGKSGAEIVADKRSNSIIVTDIPENIEKIKRIVRVLDQQPQQVLLESIIVEVTLDDSNKLGIGWTFGKDGRLRNSWGDTSFQSSGSSNFPLNDVATGTGKHV